MHAPGDFHVPGKIKSFVKSLIGILKGLLIRDTWIHSQILSLNKDNYHSPASHKMHLTSLNHNKLWNAHRAQDFRNSIFTLGRRYSYFLRWRQRLHYKHTLRSSAPSRHSLFTLSTVVPHWPWQLHSIPHLLLLLHPHSRCHSGLD